jgi:uncharacterized protein YukJ
MDGSEGVDPASGHSRMLQKAQAADADIDFFGRTYKFGDLRIHHIRMNQGFSGSFVNDGVSDANDHNDIWQDGGVIVDLGENAGDYFTSFFQQLVPTNNLGNTDGRSHEIDISDERSL